MPFEPVARQSLPDAVYDQLLTGIVGGEFEPGSVLPSERALAETLGVSRPAVREALKRLAHGGLVDIRQGDATTVRDFRQTAGLDVLPHLLVRADGSVDLDVARSIVEVRAATAPHVAGLCARRADAATVDALHATVDRMVEAREDVPALQRLALEFWDQVVAGSANVAFRLMFNALRETYEQMLDAVSVLVEDEVRDVDGHRALAVAVARHDTADAERKAARVLDRSTATALQAIEALEAHQRDH